MMRFARGSGRPSGPGDFRRALAGAEALLHDGLARRHVSLVLEIESDLPEVGCGTSDLERLLINLMTNARDAMPNGGSLTVTAKRLGGGIEIVVADTGVGMNRDELLAIERPFYTTKEHGTGLGLATCRSIAAEASGTLAIQSEAGHGTRVTLRLPANAEGADEPSRVVVDAGRAGR
jgi:hypothetical protein